MTHTIRAASLAGALISAAAAANADSTAEQVSACIGDAFRYCSAQIPSAAKVEACLVSNMSRLTPACRAQFEPETKPAPRAQRARSNNRAQ